MSQFKQGKDPANIAMRRLIRRLAKANISHALVGGLAVWAHGYHRFTDDIDVLVTPAGFEEFRRRFVPKNYTQEAGRTRRFTDNQNGVTIDILVTGLRPGFGKASPLTFPDPEAVCQVIDSVNYIDFATLIQFKLAARRYQDFGDVVNLIRANNLDDSFVDKLHESVRGDFIECLEEKRREDTYES